MLDRYANLSPKVHVQYVDLVRNPTVATAYGVRFPGTAYRKIGPRREEAKSVTEEGITGAFVKDLKGVRKVCVVPAAVNANWMTRRALGFRSSRRCSNATTTRRSR